MTSNIIFLELLINIHINNDNINIIVFSEERTSSTHALTMYRHNTMIEGKEFKIGIYTHIYIY
jgi:hypothetical protein